MTRSSSLSSSSGEKIKLSAIARYEIAIGSKLEASEVEVGRSVNEAQRDWIQDDGRQMANGRASILVQGWGRQTRARIRKRLMAARALSGGCRCGGSFIGF